jgi:protein ImuA
VLAARSREVVQALKNPFTDVDHRRVAELKGWLTRFDRRGRGLLTTISTGCPALDQLLPEGGFRRGSLVEWLGAGPGSGVSQFPVATLRHLQEQGGSVVVVDRSHRFYPPAAVAAGIDLAQVLVVRPETEADELWAIDQALRCSEVAAVLAWPERIDSFAFRRLQLAAEEHGTLGLLVRPRGVLREPTWADVRFLVSPRRGSSTESSGWRWNVQLLRAGGHFAQGQVDLELQPHDGASHVPVYSVVVSPVATPAAREQTA